MAAASVLRLKVDDKEYNASLRQAQQGMQHLEQSLQAAGKSFNQVDKAVVEYARGIGQMEAQSKTARGRIGEMSSAFVELSTQYNHMSAEVQRSDVGRALAQSMEELRKRTIAAKQELQQLNAQLGETKAPDMDVSGGLLSGLGGKLGGAMQVFAGNLMTKAAGAIANLGSEMADMVRQGVELAKQGEGIRIAFERLGRGDILDGLREATHGTVTDLELMKAAVKFNDFKLPVEELGTMLAFAQQKAKDTGQSVDYMVDSIVTGLGRKSLMILDNLGLSASEIKQRMGETGDMTKAVGEIIREQMSKAGDYVETAADRAAQANVEMQNKLEELGRTFAPIQEAGVGMFNRLKIAAIDALNGMRPFFDQFTEAGRIRQKAEDMGGSGKVSGQLNRLKVARAAGSDWYVQSSYNNTIKDYEKQISDLNIKIAAFGKGRDAIEKGHIDRLKEQKAAVEQQMKLYQDGAKQYLHPVKAVIETSGAEQNITSLTKKLKELQEQRKKAIAAGDSDLSKNLLKQINQTKADIKGLGGSVSTTTTHKATPQEQSTAKYEQAERDYRQAVEQAALEMRAGTITQEGQRRKELQAKEALWKAIGDAREIYDTPELKAAQKKAADEIVRLGGEVKSLSEAEQRAKDAARQLEQAQTKLAEAQKELAKAQASGDLKQIYAAEKKVETAQQAVTQSSTITVKVEGKEALEQLQKLEGIQTIKVNVEEGKVNLPQVPTDDQTIKVNVEEGDVNLPQVPTDDQTIKVNVEEGDVNLPQVPTDDQTIKVNVVVNDAEAIQSIQQLEDVTIDVPVNYKPQGGTLQPVDIPLTTANLDAFTSRIKEELANADIGSSAALSLQEGLSDATAIGTILQTAIQNGIDTAQFDTSGLMEKLINHKDISDEEIQAYVDQLNTLLKEKFDETEWPKVLIKFNADTKSIEKMSKEQQKDAQGMSKEWQAVSNSISAVGSAMNSIKDPTAKIVGIVMSGIASVSQGAGQAIAKAGTESPTWYEYLAAAAAITAQMVTTIAQIHDVTGYANGGIVDGRGGGFVGGTAYSGDNIGNVRLDAGELVLNRSQQGNLATALEGNTFGNMELSTRLAGEDIIITINNVGERNGHGEYIEM